jgi:hypothetical protein
MLLPHNAAHPCIAIASIVLEHAFIYHFISSRNSFSQSSFVFAPSQISVRSLCARWYSSGKNCCSCFLLHWLKWNWHVSTFPLPSFFRCSNASSTALTGPAAQALTSDGKSEGDGAVSDGDRSDGDGEIKSRPKRHVGTVSSDGPGQNRGSPTRSQPKELRHGPASGYANQ